MPAAAHAQPILCFYRGEFFADPIAMTAPKSGKFDRQPSRSTTRPPIGFVEATLIDWQRSATLVVRPTRFHCSTGFLLGKSLGLAADMKLKCHADQQLGADPELQVQNIE